MTLPFVMPDPFSFQKRTFAHYFYPYPLSIDNKPAASDYYETQYLTVTGESGKHAAYGGLLRSRPLPAAVQANFSAQVNMEIEVRAAIAVGITGFTFDILNLDDLSETGHLTNMLQAAAALDERFQILPMLDMTSLVDITIDEMVGLIESFSAYPNIARMPDGRIKFSAFDATLQTLAWWELVLTGLNDKSIDVAFVPLLLGGPASNPYAAISVGLAGWGTATAAAAASCPPCYMMPVMTQQFRPDDRQFWEASNFDAFIAGWLRAISGGAELVQIVTWGDFSETSQVQPCTDATLAPNIGNGFYNLTAYYATWFGTGAAPAITQDVLYFCYRKMPSNAARVLTQQPDPFTIVQPGVEVSQIEMLAFLTGPGTLIINGQSLEVTQEMLSASGGIISFKVPSTPGNPTMSLQRDGSNVQQGVCPVTIYGAAGSPAGTLDLTYWSGNI